MRSEPNPYESPKADAPPPEEKWPDWAWSKWVVVCGVVASLPCIAIGASLGWGFSEGRGQFAFTTAAFAGLFFGAFGFLAGVAVTNTIDAFVRDYREHRQDHQADK